MDIYFLTTLILIACSAVIAIMVRKDEFSKEHELSADDFHIIE